MSDREFWLIVRSALKMLIKAIEKRYLPDLAHTPDPAEQG